ncbi:MAG: RAMP superfamily CRISPR-associated protein [Melioribacteraceae bacterium]|nr:RAMP superfamily CRISPR-associated protein [Melioribacteraceae bacterium]
MINGIYRLTGKIALNSPLLIGSGEAETSDIDVVRDSEGKPFIPATSFIGAIKSHIMNNFETKNDDKELKDIWGFTDKQNAKASSILCSDLLLIGENKSTEIRDGIAIDPKTGIVIEHHKYDYEIVPKGAKFSLKIDAPYSEKNKKIIKKLLSTLISELEDNTDFRLGAKSTNGLGKIKLNDKKFCDFDFSNKENFVAYLSDKEAPIVKDNEQPQLYEKNQNKFTASLSLNIKNSFIQRSYPTSSDEPDAVNIKSDGKYVMTGSGTKGAIRNRALRIVNTLLNSNEEEPQFIKNLFGYVVKPDGNKIEHKYKSKAGRLRVEETTIEQYIAELQNRIALDRFTGGTMKAALYDSLALFYKTNAANMPSLILNFSVKDCSEAEAGLMLLIIKDLWTGDLAIGGEKNVGRGVFEGLLAEINFNGKKYKLTRNDTKEFVSLQEYVDSLINELGVSNGK